MMRTNIEIDLWTSGRLSKLARVMKWPEREALGAIVCVYRRTQTEKISSETLDRVVTVVCVDFDSDDQARQFLFAMCSAQLASIHEDTITINGNAERIQQQSSWLDQQHQRQVAGGKARAGKAERNENGTFIKKSSIPNQPAGPAEPSTDQPSQHVFSLMSSVSSTEINTRSDLLIPPSAEPVRVPGDKRTPQEKARAKLVKDSYLAGYREYYGRDCDTWGAPHNAHVYHLLKSSTAEILAAKAGAYFQWANKRAIDAGHPFMGHHSSFSSSLAELTADAIKPDRRKQAAVVDARMKQLDTIAQDDDMLNRMEIQQQLTKDPFDDRQWRTERRLGMGQTEHAHTGEIEAGSDASSGDTQQEAISASRDGLVQSVGATRGGVEAVENVSDGVRSGPDAINRVFQATDERPSRTGTIQTAGSIIRGGKKAF